MTQRLNAPRGLAPLDDQPGPALPLAESRVDEQIAIIVRDSRESGAPRRSTFAHRALRAAAAAALLVFVGTAAAQILPRWFAPVARPSVPAAATTPRSPGPRAVVPAESPPPIDPAAGPETPAATAPASHVVARPRPERIPARSAVAASAPAEPTASPDLLRLANGLRSERRWSEAEQVYRRVVADFPRNEESYVAQVAAAGLRADQLGDPTGALALYRAALARKPRGPLAEETRLGIAGCYRRLGDPERERQALEDLLASRPGSLLRSRAEARLNDLTRGR